LKPENLKVLVGLARSTAKNMQSVSSNPTALVAPSAPALPSQTVFGFLSQLHNNLCHFISDIMDYFLAGEDQQQTNQPKDLAGG